MGLKKPGKTIKSWQKEPDNKQESPEVNIERKIII